MDDAASLSAWPALMDRRTAADYLGVSPASLPRLLARRGVMPVELGLRLRRWRRADIDALVEDLPVRATEARHALEALGAVERRAPRQGRTPSPASRSR